MAKIMEKDKLTIKEKISTVEDTFAVYLVGEDVKDERTENQGMGLHFLNIFFRMIDFCLFLELRAHKSKSCYHNKLYLQILLKILNHVRYLRLVQYFINFLFKFFR